MIKSSLIIQSTKSGFRSGFSIVDKNLILGNVRFPLMLLPQLLMNYVLLLSLVDSLIKELLELTTTAIDPRRAVTASEAATTSGSWGISSWSKQDA